MGCPACSGLGSASHNVTYYSQYMTPTLINEIAYAGADPADDPLWQQSGAVTRAEYGRWCRHCCGMACLQMVLDHRGDQVPPLLELQRGCLAHGGYVEQDDGTIKGLFYAPFAAFAQERYGLDAHVLPTLDLEDVTQLLLCGFMVMASVHKEIRRPHHPAPGRGGHLVLVTGQEGDQIRFANPSGHTPAAREAQLPRQVFEAFFAGRGIAIR